MDTDKVEIMREAEWGELNMKPEPKLRQNESREETGRTVRGGETEKSWREQ